MSDLEDRPVVTCFLRNGPEVLLLQRSSEVGSYVGAWGAVAGHLRTDGTDSPTESAVEAGRREIREETGLDSARLVNTGDPFPVEDPELGIRWIVHPILFETDERTIEPNPETADWQWTSPTAIRELETVPQLAESYRRVAPDLRTVREDTEHGASYLAVRAGEILRDRGAGLTGRDDPSWDGIVSVARNLRATRPAMAPVRNTIDRIMAQAAGLVSGPLTGDAGTPTAIVDAATGVLEDAKRADDQIRAYTAERIAGDHCAIFSRSGTVVDALLRGSPAAVLVSEARPGSEGCEVAAALGEEGLSVTLTTDAAIPGAVAAGDPDPFRSDVDRVIIGADTVLPDGSVVNKAGSHALALGARRRDIPFEVWCTSAKISHVESFDLEEQGPLPDWPVENLETYTPRFERVPRDLVTTIVTESGPVDEGRILEIASRHSDFAEWLEEV